MPSRSPGKLTSPILWMALLAAVLLPMAAPDGHPLSARAQAAPTFLVDTVADAVDAAVDGHCATASGQCSLRAAVAEANATTGATIQVAPGDYLLNGGAGKDIGDLQLSSPMTIIGAARPPGPGATTIRGAGDRVFDVTAVVTIRGMVITEGIGGRSNGGGIYVSRLGALTLLESSLVANTASEGGGIYIDGSARIDRSTIAGNAAAKKGGGVFNAGSLALVNSTVDGNSASGGGGIASSGTTAIEAATVTNNTSNNSNGGGIYRVGGTFSISSSILADNNGPDSARDCYGTPEFIGYNLVESQPGCNPSGAVIISDDPLLGALLDNGGPTPTRLPADGSPAIDAVPPEACVVATDQRGVPRPSPTGGNCDVGAVESAPLSLTLELTADKTEIGVGVGSVPVQNIPPSAFGASTPDEPGTTGASKFGAIKFGAIKFGAIDVEASKFGAITLADLKFGAIKFGAIDLAAAKFGAILLSDIELDIDGGWAALLQGTPYEGAPLQTLTFENVVDLPAVQALTLAQIGLEDTLLRGIAVEALALGEFSLSELPLDDTVATGSDVDRLQAWCGAIGASACASMSIDPLVPSTAVDITPLTLNIAGISLEAVDLSSIKFGAIKFGAIDLASTKFGAIKFGAIKFGAIDLASTKFGAIKFGAIDLSGTKFGAIKFGAIPVADRGLIFDCSLVDCTNDSLTLADAALVGALRGTLADVIYLSDVSLEISDLTLADLFALIGIVSDLDALTIAEFFELSTVQEIYDLTLADFLPLLLDPGDLPWELIDLDATPLQNAAVPAEPVLSYSAALAIRGVPASELGVQFTLAPGFVFVPGTASFDGAIVADPVLGAHGAVVFALTNVPIGDHILRIGTRAGLVLGPATTLAEATAVAGSDAATASSSATVSVVESFELGDTPDDVKVLNNGVLVISHLRDAFDEDLYTFTITDAQAAGGATADVYLSNLFVDYDLVLYGPPLDPLRGTPTRRINGFDDQGIDSTPADDVVAPDPLHDLFIVPPAGAELHSLAANRQAFDEHLRTGTLRAGTYYLQVSGYNGAFDARPYTLRLRLSSVAPGACPPRAFSYPRPGASAVPDPNSYPLNLKTLFLVAPRQMEAWYGGAATNGVIADVEAVAAHPAVVGGLLPVDSVAAAQYETWNENPCSFEASNNVVRAIGEAIDAVRAARPSLQYVVIVGDHASIPMAALLDGVTLSNQRSFAAELGRGNEIGAAFAGGRFLSDDPYASPEGVAIYNHEIFVPELGLGRLVGRPEVIAAQLQRFIAYDGQLDPATAASPLLELNALVTGYDFLSDGADAIAGRYLQGGATVDTLINEGWSAADLRSRLFGASPPDVASVNAHFDPWRLLPADENAAGTQQNLFTTGDVVGSGVLERMFIYTMGCNSGVSLSDVAIGFPTQDWAEAFAGEGALFVGNGGFGYGDTESVALSERYYGLLTSVLVDALEQAGQVELGRAWMLAKQQYQSEVAVWTPYDEKAMQEAIFYGLPMWRLGEAPAGTSALSPASLTGVGGAAATSLTAPSATDTIEVQIIGPDVPSGASGPSTLERFDTTDGSYWVADADGMIEAMYRPIEPQVTRLVGTADVRGALITALTSYEITGWEPRYFLPSPVSGAPHPSIDALGDAIFPATLVGLNGFLDADGLRQHRLLVSAGQFRPTGPDIGTQRVFTNVGVQLVAPAPGADPSDTAAPTILRTSGAAVGATVGFVVDLDPDATFVSVLYKRADLDGSWMHVPLAPTGAAPDGAARWTGGDVTGLTGVAFEFMVQAHDAAGNTAFSDNKASDFLAAPLVGTGELQVVVSGADVVAGWYTGVVSAEIIGVAGASIMYSLDGSAYAPYEGPVSVLGEGVHILRAQDSTGAMTAVAIAIDTVAPVVDAEVQPPAGPSGVNTGVVDVEITAVDPGGSGVESLFYEATGADPSAGEVTVNARTVRIVLEASGTTVVTFRARDAAGNESAAGSIIVVIDNVAPTVEANVSPPPNGAGWSNQNPTTVTLTASDAVGVAEVRYRVDGGNEVVVAGSTASIDIVNEGATVVEFWAIDLVGNTSGTGSAIVKLDSMAPQVTIVAAPTPAPGTGGWIAGLVTLQATASDAGSGVASLTYSLNGGPEVVFTAPIAIAAEGTTVVSFVATDLAGNTASEGTTVRIDNTAPIISCGAADGVWHGTDVSIACTASDGGSGLVGNDSFSLTTSVLAGIEDANASTGMRSVCDSVGNCAQAGPIGGNKVDKKPPTISCGSADDLWHATDVSIGCTASDDGFGLAAGDASFSLTTSVLAGTENANASTGAREVCDGVGNCATAGPITGNKIDKKAPTVSCGSADGLWHAADVSIVCSASDDGSGLAGTGDTGFELSTSVPAGTEDANAATGTRPVCDSVGNCAQAGPIAGNKIDKKAPAISCGAADGVWHATDVSIGCTASDAGSGPSSASFSLVTNVSAGTEDANASTDTRSVCDSVGNCVTAGSVTGNKIDKKAPAITITTPIDGAFFQIGQTITPQFSCTDGGSGVTYCTATAINTSTPGTRVFQVSARDNVDNQSLSSATYTVGYRICLLYDPAKPQPIGGTVVIKLQLCDASGANLSASRFALQALTIDRLYTPPPNQGSSNPNQLFRYDAKLNGYIYNFDVNGLPLGVGSHTMEFSVDGVAVAAYVAPFELR